MWLTGLVAPQHVGSSQTRAQTRVPCIGRQILNHCATREARDTLLIAPEHMDFQPWVFVLIHQEERIRILFKIYTKGIYLFILQNVFSDTTG